MIIMSLPSRSADLQSVLLIKVILPKTDLSYREHTSNMLALLPCYDDIGNYARKGLHESQSS